MGTLMELYAGLFREAGPAGRTLGWNEIEREFGPEAQVFFDRDVAGKVGGNASFRKAADGTLVASMGGGRNFAFDPDAGSWAPTGKDDHSETGRMGKPLRNRAEGYGHDLWDVFSRTEPEYVRRVTAASDAGLGRGWANLIDSLYGQGSVKRILHLLWVNNWTDYEGVGELFHYYDVAQQAATQKGADRRGEPGLNDWQRQLARQSLEIYPIRIGPAWDPATDGPRTERPMSPDDLRNPNHGMDPDDAGPIWPDGLGPPADPEED